MSSSPAASANQKRLRQLFSFLRITTEGYKKLRRLWFFSTLVKITGLRKLIAIPLLAVYLFNVAGYQVLFSFAIQRSDKLFVQRLDNNQYNEDELVQISIPLHLPYYHNQTAYERIDGEVCYKSISYRYVKRKVVNDTLYILCLKNEAKTDLQSEQTAYAKKQPAFQLESRTPARRRPR